MLSRYYRPTKHSHSASDRYTLLEILDVFGLCVVDVVVKPNNSSPVEPPRRSRHARSPARVISDSVVCSGSLIGWEQRFGYT